MSILLAVLALVGLIAFRNHIAFRVISMRLEEIHSYHIALIDAGRYGAVDDGLYDSMPDYDAVMFDLTKWTYRQFFPKQIGEPQ